MLIKVLFQIVVLAISVPMSAQTTAKTYKSVGNGNPVSPCVFCADPTALEYNGRLYLYGTNDHQQYIQNGKKGSNGYGNIKSLVVFSTDDMANWTFHGTIDVGKVCGSWCGQSWAPSVVWRQNSNGEDEFFLYFANGGGSVGVIKASSPVGPWKSPLSQALIRHGMPGVDPCNWVFDPGAVIDDNGTGWIAFGGGDPQSTGSKLWPGNSRIAKLKSNMLALDGAAVNMPAPYLFEASELNMINGRYVYTYNTSWSDRNDWNKFEKRGSAPAPSTCSMCYMVSDNPLDPDSWEYRGEYVPNEGNFGMGWGNNHTHLHKYKGEYYLFYHSTLLEQTMNTGASGFRSIGVNKATVNEETQKINKITMTKAGVAQIQNLNPYLLQEAETMATCGGITYSDFSNIKKLASHNTLGNDASQNLQVKMVQGAWTMVRKADFGEEGATNFMLRVKGSGTLEIRLNKLSAESVASIEFSSSEMADYIISLDKEVFTGIHDVFFLFTQANNVMFDAWQFFDNESDGIMSVTAYPNHPTRVYDMQGHRLNNAQQHKGMVIEEYIGKDGKRRVRKQVK